jgi:hypothetical protein
MPLPADILDASSPHPIWTRRLWSLWDMLQSYLPIYRIVIDLQKLRRTAEVYADALTELHDIDKHKISTLLDAIQQGCLALGLIPPYEMAVRLTERGMPRNHAVLLSDLDHLDGSIDTELKKGAVFRIPPERKDYFEQNELFGSKVTAAFPSCSRDIEKAGSCYALGQEDACVHHLMLVVERGLTALAARVNVTYHYADWQKIIDGVETKLKAGQLPRGLELDFYRQAHAEFGFLKEAYRKHSAHARDDPYDMPKALSILNHVRDFMQALGKGGLSE